MFLSRSDPELQKYDARLSIYVWSVNLKSDVHNTANIFISKNTNIFAIYGSEQLTEDV